MKKKQEKQRFTFWTKQKTLDEINDWSERIGSKSKSEFIEDAIRFYTYPWAGWSCGKTQWRTEPTPVEKLADDLWIAEKFQSNPDIAGSPRNSFRASLIWFLPEVKHWLGAGSRDYQPLSNSECRIKQYGSQTMWDKSHSRKGNSPDLQLRSQIYAKWKRMWQC